MTAYRYERGKFHFTLASGDQPNFYLGDDIAFDGRITASGRTAIRFPAPYADLELVQGERVGRKKEERLREAIAFFQQVAKKD